MPRKAVRIPKILSRETSIRVRLFLGTFLAGSLTLHLLGVHL
jgi:hypothetical protein